MANQGFSLTCRQCAIQGKIVPETNQLAIDITYAGGAKAGIQLQDGGQSAGRPGRFNTWGQPGNWPFFTADSVIEVIKPADTDPDTQTILIRTPLAAGTDQPDAAVVYQLDFHAALSAIQIRTCFTGLRNLIVESLSWLDMAVESGNLSQFHGCLPHWDGQVRQMTEPLAFRDAVALHDGRNTLAVGNSGRILLFAKPESASARLAPFIDLLGFRDDLAVFDPSAPLSAWLSLAPWSGGDALPEAFRQLAARTAVPMLLPAADPTAIPASDTWSETVTLSSGVLSVDLARKADGLALAAIRGETPVFAGLPPRPLFTLKVLSLLNHKVAHLSSAAGWGKVRIQERSNCLVLTFSDPLIQGRKIRELSVQLTCVADPSRNRLTWQTRINNQHPSFSVLACDYPNSYVNQGEWDLLQPVTSGVLLRDACRHGSHLACIYPAYTVDMPYFAACRPGRSDLNGFYTGIHDPEGCRKDIYSTTLPGAELGHIRYDYPAEGLGLAGNSFSLPGSAVWQLFSGDWYDATLIYRDFVHQDAVWLPDKTLDGRPDTPEWMRDVPFWIMDWLPNGNPDKEPIPVSIRPEVPPGPRDWIDGPLELQKALEVPIGYHVYNWHWIPFNNDFPHYFPTEPGFKEGVQELQNQQIHVMPYINGRLWDVLDKRDQDYRFSTEALPHAAKHFDQTAMAESYASHEPDGQLCQLAVMCPSTAFWCRELESITTRLFNEVGVDAVYIDQVAAAAQVLCCDRTHPHLPGGGSWWNHSYAALMDRLNQQKPADRAFVTECNAEPHAGSFDGFLTWQWIEANQVPAFPAIYAGKVAMLGRNTNGYKKKDIAYFKFHAAEQVLYGQQIGWINADVVRDAGKFPFLKKMVQLRWQYRRLFATGQLLRPPVVHSDLDDVASFAGMGRPLAWNVFAMPSVLAGLWRQPDGQCVLMVFNTADQTACCEIAAAIPAGCRPQPAAAITRSSDESLEPVNLEWQRDQLKISCKLAAEGILVLDWQGVKEN